jgi:hypothetical protein
MERDDLHRDVLRTQRKLTSCFGYDAMGRKSWQFASTMPAEKLSQILNPGDNSLLVEHAQSPIHRRYEYDPAGEMTRTLDKLRGEIKYEYEANGQLHSRDTGRLVDSEEFRYDAAANRLNFNTSQFDQVKDNRIKRWRDQEYAYDAWGNLIEKRSGLSKLQTFSYDCEKPVGQSRNLVWQATCRAGVEINTFTINEVEQNLRFQDTAPMVTSGVSLTRIGPQGPSP